MLLPVNATLAPSMRFSRGITVSRPVGSTAYKTVVIPAAAPAIAPAPAEEPTPAPLRPEPVPGAPTPAEVLESEEQAAEEKRARKLANAREKRKRKKAATKAAAAVATAADADEADSDVDEVAEKPIEAIEVLAEVSVTPQSVVEHVAAPLTPVASASGSSDGKVSGASTPASSHGFATVPRQSDWANDTNEDIPVPDFGDGIRPKSSASDNSRAAVEAAARAAYSEKLANDPSYTPRMGKFWGHDERLLESDLRGMSGWWRGRQSPAPGQGERSASPAATSSDGGWQEVGKAQRQPRNGGGQSWRLARDDPAAPATKGKPVNGAGPKSSWGKGNYVGQSGLRAWADEDESHDGHAGKPTAHVGSVDPNRPPEPPWTARSPVPYLFNTPGSRSYVDDNSRQRQLVVRVSLRPVKRGAGARRPPELSFTSKVKLPGLAKPDTVTSLDQPIRINVGKGRATSLVYPPLAEQKRLDMEAAARAVQAERDLADAEAQRVEAEARAAAEEAAGQEAAEREAAYNRQRAEIERRELEAAQAALAAAQAMRPSSAGPVEPVPMEAPIPSTSTAPLRPPSVVSAPHDAGMMRSSSQTAVHPMAPPPPVFVPGMPPPHLQQAYMFPAGPFTFEENMGPPGHYIFDAHLGYVIPFQPFYPPPPGASGFLQDGSGTPISPVDYMAMPPHAGLAPPPPQPGVPQPAFFAPARSSKVQIRAPSPGHTPSPGPRVGRRHPGAGGPPRSHNESPAAGRGAAPTPVEEQHHVIPGSYTAGGAVFFDAPPPFFYPPPPQAYYGPAPPQHPPTPSRGPGGAELVDPAILSVTPGAGGLTSGDAVAAHPAYVQA